MYIFHSQNIPNNSYLLDFVINLKELKLVFGRTEEMEKEEEEQPKPPPAMSR